jgi:ankyrin repeat protein
MTGARRRRTPHRVAFVAVGIVVPLLLAGCGGGDDADASAGKTPSVPATSSRTSVTTAPGGATATAPESPEPTRSTPVNTAPSRSQTELDLALIDAAWSDDVPRARRLIAAGADVNAQDETQQSAYLIATSEGYLDLLELTLDSGADVRSLDSFEGTGLIRAAERGHADIVGRLLRTDIDVDHVNNLGWTALHEAIVLGEGTTTYVDTVRLLVAGGADVRIAPERDGIPPVEHARSRGFDAIATSLQRTLDEGRIPDADQALLDAAVSGDADAAALALRSGARLETRDAERRTPLLLAVTHDHVDVARLLVALGADADALDAQHDTPWLVTGVTGSVPMLEVLLRADPDLTIRNRYGGISVIPASERGHVAYVRRVVGTPIDVNHVNDLGWTAMLEAIILGDGSRPYQQIVRILLEAGADPAIADFDGVTPLRHAESRGFDEIARALRRAG